MNTISRIASALLIAAAIVIAAIIMKPCCTTECNAVPTYQTGYDKSKVDVTPSSTPATISLVTTPAPTTDPVVVVPGSTPVPNDPPVLVPTAIPTDLPTVVPTAIPTTVPTVPVVVPTEVPPTAETCVVITTGNGGQHCTGEKTPHGNADKVVGTPAVPNPAHKHNK